MGDELIATVKQREKGKEDLAEEEKVSASIAHATEEGFQIPESCRTAQPKSRAKANQSASVGHALQADGSNAAIAGVTPDGEAALHGAKSAECVLKDILSTNSLAQQRVDYDVGSAYENLDIRSFPPAPTPVPRMPFPPLPLRAEAEIPAATPAPRMPEQFPPLPRRAEAETPAPIPAPRTPFPQLPSREEAETPSFSTVAATAEALLDTPSADATVSTMEAFLSSAAYAVGETVGFADPSCENATAEATDASGITAGASPADVTLQFTGAMLQPADPGAWSAWQSTTVSSI